MMTLEDIKKDRKLINLIDWDMTPEEAVRLYLEWGNNWTRGNYVIRSKTDFSHYFAVYTWKDIPIIYLIKRNSDEALELAQFAMPDDIREHFLKSIGYNKGVYAIDEEIKTWLKSELV